MSPHGCVAAHQKVAKEFAIWNENVCGCPSLIRWIQGVTSRVYGVIMCAVWPAIALQVSGESGGQEQGA